MSNMNSQAYEFMLQRHITAFLLILSRRVAIHSPSPHPAASNLDF
jgi:hypothetical protein